MFQFDSTIFHPTQGVYIVGGSVRDLLLKKMPTDYDICVLGNPENYANRLAAGTKGHQVKIGKSGQMIIRVTSGSHIFDISPATGTCIEDDLRQRDFTVNAMAYDLSSGKIIDVLGGLRDLDKKIIRSVSKQVFRKDPVRLIRAFRIAAGLDFEIDPGTISTITRDAALIKKTAGERIRAELFKMLSTRKSHYYLCHMADTGLLAAIFPELDPLKGCFQNRYHRYDAFEHSIRAYYHLEAMLSGRDKLTDKTLRRIITEFDPDKAMLLKCAILLHDIGKPAVKSIDNLGNVHFHGHARKGADMAITISKRLKFSTRARDFIDFIIRNHIRPLSLFIAHQNQTLTPRGITRFFMKCGDNTPYLLLHTIADAQGKQNKTNAKNNALIAFAKARMCDFFSGFSPKSKTAPLITGYDLMHEFGLSPSPLFKKILKLVEEARLSNAIHSKPAALKLVREFLKK
ncbi:MAG: CCA tRNA nucleotidyltransferase [Proteobacteria bacterium]|nr:CCA tRNA nucleotidyltransferase [Pseudomonadota bacterium]